MAAASLGEENRARQVSEEGEAPLLRRLAAEFVGTLVFVAVGTGAATVLLLGPLQRLSALPPAVTGGGPEGEALFGTLLGTQGSQLGDVLPVAFAFATALAVLVYAMGGVSGAHFNPAVTFGLAVARRFRWTEVPLYWVVQCVGAIGGAFVIAGIYGKDGAIFEGTDILFGATLVNPDITEWQAILAEAFIAFVLVTAIMAVAVDPRAPKGWSGLIIGLALGGGILVTAAATGGSANFARSLGPLVASLFYDVGDIPWGDLYVFAVGPLIGASAAALVYESVTGLERFAPAPSPGAATPPTDAVDTFPPPPVSGEPTGAPPPPSWGSSSPPPPGGLRPPPPPGGDYRPPPPGGQPRTEPPGRPEPPPPPDTTP